MSADAPAAENGFSLRGKGLQKSQLGRYAMVTVALWTSVLAAFLVWNNTAYDHYCHDVVLRQARAFFEQILTTRAWNASHGGVYVPVTTKTQPNPYLRASDRDLVTLDGKRLTKINPAYMTRQIAEIAAARNGVKFHITSLKPIRPENAADAWEQKALRSFSSGVREVMEHQDEPGGEAAFRYMAPLWVEESCLSCHRAQGYKVGDLRGGISVTLPGKEMQQLQRRHFLEMSSAYLIIWLLGLTLLSAGYYQLKKSTDQREELIGDLRKALAEVKTLSGLLPICASCKKIRDDKGYWNQIEVYFQQHSRTQFSHGICPDCLDELYPDISDEIQKKESGSRSS